jgi:hexosaminidase
VINQFKVLDKMKVNYAKSIYNITGKVIPANNGIAYELSTSQNSNGIRYTLDGTDPTINSKTYQKAVQIPNSLTIKCLF